MHIVGFAALLLALLGGLGLAGYTIVRLIGGQKADPVHLERGQSGIFLLFLLGSAVLLWALMTRNFSFVYVADYSDRILPLFYAATAFWAGQSGSILFWGLVLSFFGFLWSRSPRYRSLETGTKNLFWVFFLTVECFFLLLLTGPANPFLTYPVAPPDGSGLNPLLQHPGMIFHPPVLFMGYAGFTIPACLAFASVFAKEERSWLRTGRNWSILSWIFLSIGILLGGWWSYLELGWGGYWAWDPVENASLVPWLVSSAFLHTAVIGRRKGALSRTNIFLIGLTLALCFFGTYIVRSGVIQSLHAFGARGLGVPLLALVAGTLLLSGWAAFASQSRDSKELGHSWSRQGFMTVIVLTLS
ncbi:MAG: cytochrome c biogenesis protein CcsA, partial [Desulfovibrionales bacterium]